MAIEMAFMEDFGNMPGHWYDKQAYSKLQPLVGICLHRMP